MDKNSNTQVYNHTTTTTTKQHLNSLIVAAIVKLPGNYYTI